MRFPALVSLAMCCSPLAAQFNMDLNSPPSDNLFRDDQLWHGEAANVVPRHAANVSLVQPMRFGLTERLELSTSLAADAFVPNVALKKLWRRNRQRTHFWASKFNVAMATPLVSFAKRRGYDAIADSAGRAPLALSVGHELIYSHAFRNDPNCTRGNEWLVLTASLEVDFGVLLAGDESKQPEYHFLANRTATMVDNGAVARAKLWADWLMGGSFVLHGGVRFYVGSFTKMIACEQQAEVEMFFSKRFSIKGGVMLSQARYTNVDKVLGVMPFADVVFYIGRKKSGEYSLFNPNGIYY